MKTRIKTTLLTLAIIFSSVQIFAQDAYNLNYKYEKGKEYLYRSSTITDVNINAMGQDISINTTLKTKLRLNIAELSAEKIEIIISADSLVRKMNNPMAGGEVENKGEAVTGKKSKLVYEYLGKKLVTGTIDKMDAEADLIAEARKNILFQLPGKAVKIGDVWNVVGLDTTQIAGGNLIFKSNTDYKVEGKENKDGIDYIKISLSGTMKIEGSMSQQGMDMVMEGTGKSTGIILFDVSKGILYSSDITNNSDITMAIPSQNMTMPMISKTKISTTFVGN